MAERSDTLKRTVWRLERKRYARTAFTGEGARLYGGRFNSKGTPVVYAAENLPLALLETLVGLTDYEQLYQYVFYRAEMPEEMIEDLLESDLPSGWDAHPPAAPSQRIGDEWAQSGRSLALRVPSVIVPYSFNYVINPEHPDFEALTISEAEALPVDDRLVG